MHGVSRRDVLFIADGFKPEGDYGLVLELEAAEEARMWFTREQVEEIVEHLQRALAGPLGKLVIQAEKEPK